MLKKPVNNRIKILLTIRQVNGNGTVTDKIPDKLLHVDHSFALLDRSEHQRPEFSDGLINKRVYERVVNVRNNNPIRCEMMNMFLIESVNNFNRFSTGNYHLLENGSVYTG